MKKKTLDGTTSQTTSNLAVLFECQAAKTPNNVAGTGQKDSLTYSQLNDRANQLARHLIIHGITPGEAVAVCVNRNINILPALLAILKAGAIYLPIDQHYPKERTQYILEDADAKIIIAETTSSQALPSHIKTILLDDFEKPWQDCSKENLSCDMQTNDAAYIIYTSGSTGKPKGILQTHQTIANLINWQSKQFRDQPYLNIAQFAAFGFDVSLQEIFYAILNGYTLYICPQAIREDTSLLPNFITDHNINILFLPTSILDYFSFEAKKQAIRFTSLEKIIVAGETLRITKDVRNFFSTQPTITLENQYGPSETHVASYHTLSKNPSEWPEYPPIGKAIDNTTLYIMDPSLQRVSAGEPGELCISGAGLAKAYLNLSRKKTECFIEINISGTLTRVYRTGDTVKAQADGLLKFIGRSDNQIKIRGYRVELNEIESALLQHEDIKQCAVVVGKIKNRKFLTAYIKSESKNLSTDLTAIRTYLGKKIPSYMIPSAFVLLEKLPMTLNLKVDKQKLAYQAANDIAKERKITPPKTQTQKELIGIFSDLLKIDARNIGINDSIYELGIDSIAAMRIISRLKTKYSNMISIKTFFTTETIENLALAVGQKNKKEKKFMPLQAKTSRQGEHLPLTPSQQSLWFIQNLDPANPFYNESIILELEGNLNKPALLKALDAMYKRHEVFHSMFSVSDGLPYQIIDPPEGQMPLHEKKILASELEKKLRTIVDTAFRLENNHLYKVYLLETSKNSHVLAFVLHHIIIDGWSLDIIHKELTEFYHAFLSKKNFSPAPPNIHPSDYARWLNQNDYKTLCLSELTYWKNKLNNNKDIKFRIPAKSTHSEPFKGGNIYFKLDRKETDQLINLSVKMKTTLFNVLSSCLAVMLYKYSGQTDFSIGTSASTRNYSELEPLIGFFSNTIALRNDLSNNPSFANLLQRNETVILDAQANSNINFIEVVKSTCPKRNSSRNPVFQALISLEPLDTTTPNITELTRIKKLKKHNIKFDIMLLFEISNRELIGNFEYSKNIFNESMASDFIKSLKHLVTLISQSPTMSLNQIDILDKKQRRHLIHDFNKTKKYRDYKTSVHHLIQSQALTAGSNKAITFHEETITYTKLNKRANQLAHYINQYNLPENSLIGIYLPRCIDAIISIIAVLKCGHAFMPIDPNFPINRTQHMLNDSHAEILITNARLSNQVQKNKLKLVYLDEDKEKINKEQTNALDKPISPEDLAYVIYTSGSTGMPKGVMLRHKNLSNLITDLTNTIKKSSFDRTLGLTTFSFDIAYLEIFGPLTTGGQLILADECAQRDPEKIISLMKTHNISLMQATPSTWKMLFNFKNEIYYKALTAIVGGEALSKSVAHRFVAEKIPTWITYGPTETTIWSTICKLNETNTNHPPLGRPIGNTAIYILDDDLNPTPIGTFGSLYIAGDGLAKGYLNNSALTDEKFIKNPLCDSRHEKLYKTGDLAYWDDNGNLYFIGREDNQLKLRGFRIDTDEIDYHLSHVPHIAHAFTSITQNNNPTLISYVEKNTTSKSNITKEQILQELSKNIPSYMMPSDIIILDKFPITPNGKLDRKALPKPYETTDTSTQLLPKTETEKELSKIWQKLLGLSRVSKDNNFFEMGGHSLLSVQLVSEINNQFKTNLPVKCIFQTQTLAELSKLIDKIKKVKHTFG